jgi:hypothetical protein
VNALVLSGEVSLKTLPCHKHPATVWDRTIQHEVAVLRMVACGAHDNPGLDEHDVWGRVVFGLMASKSYRAREGLSTTIVTASMRPRLR